MTELANGCWSVVSSNDCLNHEPLSVSVRIFQLPVLVKFIIMDSKDYLVQLKSDFSAIRIKNQDVLL